MEEVVKDPYRVKDFSYSYPVSRIGWGAVIAGFFIATVTQLLLNILGFAIGLSVFDPQGTSGTAMGIGAVIWTIVTSLISVFVGAWVAGRYTSIRERGEGPLQGALVWALSLLFVTWLAGMGITSAVSGVMSIVGKGASVAAQGASQMGSQQQNDVGRGAGSGAGSTFDREKAINALTNTGMSREDAEKAVNQFSNPDQMKEQATEVAGTTAKVGAAAAWWFFITAFLSLGAAIWGGQVGFKNRDYVKTVRT